MVDDLNFDSNWNKILKFKIILERIDNLFYYNKTNLDWQVTLDSL